MADDPTKPPHPKSGYTPVRGVPVLMGAKQRRALSNDGVPKPISRDGWTDHDRIIWVEGQMGYYERRFDDGAEMFEEIRKTVNTLSDRVGEEVARLEGELASKTGAATGAATALVKEKFDELKKQLDGLTPRAKARSWWDRFGTLWTVAAFLVVAGITWGRMPSPEKFERVIDRVNQLEKDKQDLQAQLNNFKDLVNQVIDLFKSLGPHKQP